MMKIAVENESRLIILHERRTETAQLCYDRLFFMNPYIVEAQWQWKDKVCDVEKLLNLTASYTLRCPQLSDKPSIEGPLAQDDKTVPVKSSGGTNVHSIQQR